MWIDTHCHLDAAEFAADRDAVVADAQAAGVACIVVPAVAAANFAAVKECCTHYAGCVAAYGIHPLYTPQAAEADLQTLRDCLSREPAVAIGEIGLDQFVPGLDPARQLHFFVEQLKIARDFDLPVLLHVRRAIDPILRELRRLRVRGGIAHAFNGSRQQAEQFIALGFKLGFGGAMTWPRASHLRALAAALPEEAIVLETDAPDIPPEFVGRGRNAPVFLPRIAESLAELRGVSPVDVANFTTRNACDCLPALIQ
ncbi:MAG: TatD family hydrolase [Rhodocyclaceae bacterium]|jgi:TatD DNase family protein|nr:TatD family hydrolase [Rhodocyclaceae bacterium]